MRLKHVGATSRAMSFTSQTPARAPRGHCLIIMCFDVYERFTQITLYHISNGNYFKSVQSVQASLSIVLCNDGFVGIVHLVYIFVCMIRQVAEHNK